MLASFALDRKEVKTGEKNNKCDNLILFHLDLRTAGGIA